MMVGLVTTACTCNRLRQSILSGPPFFPSALFRIIAKILIAIRRPHLIWGVCESSLPRHVANTIIQFKKFIRFWNVWHAQSVHWPLWSKHLLNCSSLGSELVGKVILLPRVFILSLFSISTSQILVAILWPDLGHPARRWKWALKFYLLKVFEWQIQSHSGWLNGFCGACIWWSVCLWVSVLKANLSCFKSKEEISVICAGCHSHESKYDMESRLLDARFVLYTICALFLVH